MLCSVFLSGTSICSSLSCSVLAGNRPCKQILALSFFICLVLLASSLATTPCVSLGLLLAVLAQADPFSQMAAMFMQPPSTPKESVSAVSKVGKGRTGS